MIEARIKRALWAVSILIALGFGGHGAYKFFDAYQIDTAAQQWHDLNDKWYSETCGRAELDSAARSVCNDAWKMRAYYSYGPNRAREEGATSLAVAIAVPVGLWSLFLLLRWIWTGDAGPPKSPETQQLSPLKRKSLYWILGVIACVALFAVNVLVLPPGRALQVLISSVVQVVGLVVIVWIARVLYTAVHGRAQRKERAAQQGAPVDPPQASGH